MSFDVSDKVVVITGGAMGIGYEIAEKFLRNNAKVVIILDVNEEHGSEAARKLNDNYGRNRAVFIKCDVTKDLEAVSESLFKIYNNIDVLMNNAGIFNEALMEKTIDINLYALINFSLKFYEHMREDKNGKGGTIINMSSIAGFRIIEFTPFYQASKFAVFGFTKSLGHVTNYKRTGVRVVGICPGFTETSILNDAKPWDEAVSTEFSDALKKQIYQKPEVVGEAVIEVFLKAPSGTNWLIEGAQPIVEV